MKKARQEKIGICFPEKSKKNLKRKRKMMAFQIQDDKKLILEKNLKSKSKMTILGIDDHTAKDRHFLIVIQFILFQPNFRTCLTVRISY